MAAGTRRTGGSTGKFSNAPVDRVAIDCPGDPVVFFDLVVDPGGPVEAGHKVEQVQVAGQHRVSRAAITTQSRAEGGKGLTSTGRARGGLNLASRARKSAE
jgi:hypothetical protein